MVIYSRKKVKRMQNKIIETYLNTAWISAKNAAKVREIACKVAEFYRAKDIGTKPGISTAQAKQALCALPLTDTARAELSRRLNKFAAISSGAKCDGSLMTDPQRWTESSLLLRCRI
jgi:hypothetical protein